MEKIRESGLKIITPDESLNEQIDKLSPENLAKNTRYRDVKVIVELADDNGEKIDAEIQICTPEMAAATNLEHSLYEIKRSLEADQRTEKNPDKYCVMNSLFLRMSKLNEEFYVAVSQLLIKRTK